METPAQTGGRLLAAFEELVAQESVAVNTADYPALAVLQERAAAVSGKLGALAGDPAVAALRPQVEALLERRRQTHQMLALRLAGARLELDRLQSARQRVARLVPVYRSLRGLAPRFTAAA
jgi:hypothetical protein